MFVFHQLAVDKLNSLWGAKATKKQHGHVGKQVVGIVFLIYRAAHHQLRRVRNVLHHHVIVEEWYEIAFVYPSF